MAKNCGQYKLDGTMIVTIILIWENAGADRADHDAKHVHALWGVIVKLLNLFFLAKYIENDAKHEHALGRISRFTFSKLNQFTKYQRISIKGRYQVFPSMTEDLNACRHLCQGSPVVIATNEAELWNHWLRIRATVKVPPVWVLWQMQSDSY